MACCTAEVEKTAFSQQDDPLTICKFDFINLRLHIVPREIAQACHLNFAVEVTNIPDDRTILHGTHMIDGNDVLVTGTGDENVTDRGHVFHGRDFIAFHCRLQCTDRINFRDHNARTLAAHAFSGTLTNIAITADHGNLTCDHHIGRAFDTINKAFTAAIEIVELRLCHAVIDVDGRHAERACFCHFIKTQNTCRGFF